MLTVIIIMTLGMAAGYLLRKHKKLYRGLDKTVSYVIYLLLFLLGITVGRNDTIVRSFHIIGLKALAITSASVAGSLILGALVFHLFFRHDHVDKNDIPSRLTQERTGESAVQGIPPQGDEA